MQSFDEFGAACDGGRGEDFIIAQQATSTRAGGIRQLVGIVTKHSRAESRILVDLLGGDGLVSRVMSAALVTDKPVIVTCDASPFMVQAAWTQHVPALLQRAEASLFRSESVGGVLLAYGSHHIPPADRHIVAGEAFRILQPGGVFVVHDFLEGSPVDTWFTKVVNVYSLTGHDYVHFAYGEIDLHLQTAGFADITHMTIDDSFTVWAPSREGTELELGRYLFHMYGLVRLAEESSEHTAYRRAFELAADIFRYEQPDGSSLAVSSEYDQSRSMWSMTMPRQAVIGFGRKS